MHDKDFIRKNPDAFKAALKRRPIENVDALVNKLLELDAEDRGGKTEIQNLQARANEVAKQIPVFKKEGKDIAPLLAEGKTLKEKIAAAESGEGGKMDTALATIPNILAADVPDGKDESANKEIRRFGSPPPRICGDKFDPPLAGDGVSTPRSRGVASASANVGGWKDHVALGEALGMMDFESAAKISGARFVVLKKDLARLERALASFMLDIHTGEFGYTEHVPPLLVRDHTLFGTGQLPKFEEDLFSTSKQLDEAVRGMAAALTAHMKSGKFSNEFTPEFLEEIEKEMKSVPTSLRYWLIPTAEVSLTNLVREEILDAKQLPMRLTAWTPCFRSEAGAAGKDTRGMIRQHQFSKVELVSITTPEESEAEHERMTGCAEEILKRLDLHYRVMLLCAGDTGFSARKTYDIEVWLPGQNAFREISSCSNCGDFQARRMKARYRKSEKETAFVHTLNGSGLAVGRTLIAVLENYQQADGSIAIPEALQPYMGGKKVISGKA